MANEAAKVEELPSTVPDMQFASFNDIRDVVEVGDEKWTATEGVIRLKAGKVRWYTQKDGLPGAQATDIINFNNNIWVGMQGGIAKYNKETDKFIPYLEGQANVTLFNDTYTNTLYASTFRGFYKFNESTNEWTNDTSANAPVDSSQIVFTSDKIIGTSFHARPVVVFDRNKQVWEKFGITEFGDQQGFRLFKINDRVVLYGRSTKYSGCSEDGKEPASVFVEWNGNAWIKIDALNQFFINNEPHIAEITGNSATFTYAKNNCNSDTTNTKQITADFSNASVTLGTEIDSTYIANTSATDKIYDEIGIEISNALKLSPLRLIKAIDSEGNLLAQTGSLIVNGTSNIGGNGFARLKPTKDGYAEEAIITNDAKVPSSVEPIMCTTNNKTSLSYILAQNIDEMGGEVIDSYLYSVDSNFKATKVEGANIKSTFGNNSERVCQGDDLYTMDNNGTGHKTNLKDFTTVEFAKVNKTFGQSQTFAEGTNIWFYSPTNKELVRFDTTAKTLAKVSIDSIAGKLTNESQLVAVDDKSIWIDSSGEGSNKTKTVYIIDMNDKELGSFEITNEAPRISLINDNYAIGNKRDGVFVVDRATYKITMFDKTKLPFWGIGEKAGDDFSSYNRISYDFMLDNKYSKIWFFQSGLAFSIGQNLLP